MSEQPDRSWWENVPRAVWPDVRRHHEARMAGTRFAKVGQLATAVSVSSEDEGRWRRAKAKATEEAVV